jgi:hypothetical protein
MRKIAITTKYEADDGKIFDTEYACLEYEFELRSTKVYLVIDTIRNNSIPSVCSTRRIAEKVLNTHNNSRDYIIVPTYIDKYAIRDKEDKDGNTKD